MKPTRILFTGYLIPQLQRCMSYALELGATVLYAGYDTAFPVMPPAGYDFVKMCETVPEEMLRTLSGEGFEENFAAATQQLTTIAADFAPNIYHAMGMDMIFSAAVKAQLHPLLLSASGYLERLVYVEPQLKGRQKGLLAVDKLLVDSPRTAAIVRPLLPPTIAIEEFIVGINSRHFYPASAEAVANWRRVLQLPPEATVIFSARGWGRDYGHEYILAAFAQALPKLPAPAFLLFVTMGRTGSRDLEIVYFEKVRQQARTLGIEEHIRWLPVFPATTIATLYNVANLIVSYRWPDTFPSTVLEAMACARPVISARLPSFEESVIAEHCLLVPPHNIDALAAAMVESIHNPPTAAALEAGRQAVLARYDKPVTLQRLEEIYNSLLEPSLSTTPKRDL